MKRRSFLRNIGLGTAGMSIMSKGLSQNNGNNFPAYQYGTVNTVEDALTKEGQIILRILFEQTETELKNLKNRISVENGSIDRIKAFHFEKDEDILDSESYTYQVHVTPESSDVLVIWLNNPVAETTVYPDTKKKHGFTLAQIIEAQDLKIETEGIKLSVNLLLDKEIGEINPSDVGISKFGNDFSFVVMADPQGGDARDEDGHLRTRMKIHNAFIEESVDLVNKLKLQPAFTLVVGDVTDDWGYEKDFIQMNAFLKKLKTPVLYEIGNHETQLNSKFSPGYNMNPFNNYFAAQKDINGLDKLLYSFNLGKWHFIVWPDPLRTGFWESHPHYFDWLERDLEKHKNKPTIVFQHVPIHPIGINPLVYYAESVTVKRLLLETFSKHGNVKYVLSGHVHIPVKSSIKTATEINGIKFINLPAAGYRPRAFGESDYFGGPSQGIAIVDIKDNDAVVTFKTLTEEEFIYPNELPAFDEVLHATWFNYKYELPASDQVINPDFKKGLKGWYKEYVYEEDGERSNICEVRDTDGQPSLYMFTKCRGYMAPGQDRLPQDINRICHAVQVKPGSEPIISFAYKLDGKNCDFSGMNGSYIGIEGFEKSVKKLDLMLSANKAYANTGHVDWNNPLYKRINLDLNNQTDQWFYVIVNPKEILGIKQPERKFSKLAIDRIVITLGIWNVNDGREQPFASYFKNIQVSYNKINSNINGQSIREKDNDKDVWWRGKTVKNDNIAGEHRYWLETEINYPKK